MLPHDIKARRTAAAIANVQQTRLDDHLHEIPPKKVVVPYTDILFRDAAIEWLISTSQVRLYCSSQTLI
jgi:hypothetical protein